LDASERGLTVDVLNESLWRLALEAEGKLGSREAIIDRYQALSRLLDDRLGLEPSRETRAIFRRLLSQA
jgi:DNA-binding SARP family transcriptional activator